MPLNSRAFVEPRFLDSPLLLFPLVGHHSTHGTKVRATNGQVWSLLELLSAAPRTTCARQEVLHKYDDILPSNKTELLVPLGGSSNTEFSHLPRSLGHFAEDNSIP